MTIFPSIAQGLEEIGQNSSEKVDLGRAALMLARVSRPETKMAPYIRHFERLAVAVREYAAGAIDVSTQHEALVQVICRRFGYTGTLQRLDILEAANLMRVIDRRTGLPVALGIIYINVAQKLGWSACGINFPGRFLVRLEAGHERRIIDPFEQGQALSSQELRWRLKNLAGENAELKPDYYDSMTSHAILLRLEENRRVRLIAGQCWESAIQTVEGMLMIAPNNADLWREKGALQALLGHKHAAIESLEKSLQHSVCDTNRYTSSAMIQELRQSLL